MQLLHSSMIPLTYDFNEKKYNDIAQTQERNGVNNGELSWIGYTNFTNYLSGLNTICSSWIVLLIAVTTDPFLFNGSEGLIHS